MMAPGVAHPLSPVEPFVPHVSTQLRDVSVDERAALLRPFPRSLATTTIRFVLRSFWNIAEGLDHARPDDRIPPIRMQVDWPNPASVIAFTIS